MKSAGLCLLLLLAVPAAAHSQAPTEAHASYSAYLGGLHVADLEADLGLGPNSYQVAVAYHTTGITSVFVHGHQSYTVSGSWAGMLPRPTEFLALGQWHGEQRVVRIDYQQGSPVIRELAPTVDVAREAIPPALEQNTIDTVSALAQLVRRVERTGTCSGSVRTFDGRRVATVQAVTGGEETLQPTSRSLFSGNALRCDFTAQQTAGFKVDDDPDKDRKPLHGSAWLAPLRHDGPSLPVRLSFETHGLGTMTMYLTAISNEPAVNLSLNQH
jgi:Protein of unknown function (DUF3108)